MICVLSPAKTMLSAAVLASKGSLLLPEIISAPSMLEQAEEIAHIMKSKSKKELKDLCGVSDNLSSHVKSIYDNFVSIDDKASSNARWDPERFNQAAIMFNGPAFQGLDATSLEREEVKYVQKHLRILTGLYGSVKPGDMIQEHRLCMGTKLQIGDNKDLYAYWHKLIAEDILADLEKQEQAMKSSKATKNVIITPLLVNCASQEYFKSISCHIPDHVRVVECVFLDAGAVKSVYAKRARGLMARYVCSRGDIMSGSDIDVDKIKLFDAEGYSFSPSKSSANQLVFDRPKPLPAVARPARQLLSAANVPATEASSTKEGADPPERKGKRKHLPTQTTETSPPPRKVKTARGK